MYRIDDTTAASSLPAVPTDNVGTPGFFTGGNPGASPAVPPTRVRFWWLNLIQESLMALLTAAGLTPSKSDSTLVLQAIRVLPPGRLLRAPISYGVPGVYTYAPPAGTNFLDIEFVGGGGGAGSPNSGTLWSGSGGGAGGAGRKRVAHTPGRSYTITVAAYGVQGAGGSNGTTGGTTSFDTICSATGGIGGTANGGGGVGGVAYGADVAFVGAIGADGIMSSSGLSNGLYIGTGMGGASIYGGGGSAVGTINNSIASPTYGAGGGGAYLRNSLNGGNGGGGFVSIRELS